MNQEGKPQTLLVQYRRPFGCHSLFRVIDEELIEYL